MRMDSSSAISPATKMGLSEARPWAVSDDIRGENRPGDRNQHENADARGNGPDLSLHPGGERQADTGHRRAMREDRNNDQGGPTDQISVS